MRQLNQLCGVGIDSAWLYVMEFFAWRQFRNRRQVGGLAGLTDTHYYQSGDSQDEQGISKAGNRWVRALAINTAWAWLRYQPQSSDQWVTERAQQHPSTHAVLLIVLANHSFRGDLTDDAS